MTAISGAAAGRISPRDRLQSELSAEVASGKIQSADKDALSSALDTIDSALKAGGASRTAGSGRPDPKALQAKVADLIDTQVKAGTLTSDQAIELKQVFQQTFQGAGKGGHHDHGGPGGPGGAGGPPPGGPPPGGDKDGDKDASSSTSASSTASSDAAKLLADLLKNLQEAAAKTTSYGADGSKDASATSLLVDTTA